ncbi:DUF5412 family protein [Clostridium cadaveris]|uniref:DUF5412 family protein n=1 Tax=Clostridium cadaveris TaxID=1529 RepID=UPI0031DE75A1
MKKFFVILTSLFIILSSIFFINKYLNSRILNLPDGELIEESTSPNGKYTIKTYLCDGNATVDFSVRAELLTNSKNPKNIYWEYKTNKSKIKWLNNTTVIINGHKLKLPNDIYDWRK